MEDSQGEVCFGLLFWLDSRNGEEETSEDGRTAK